MKKIIKRFLVFALVFSMLVPAVQSSAAAAPKLNATVKTITGVGKTYTLSVSNMPAKATVTWTSSKKSYATVKKSTASGSKAVVTAVKKGTSTITATIKKSGKVIKKLTCKVTVLVPAKGIKINNAKINKEFNAQIIEMGSTYDFNRTLKSSSSKSTSSDKTVWFIEDPSIAKVSGGGVVTPLKVGNTNLIVCTGKNKAEALDNYENGTKYDKVGIKIVNPSIAIVYTLKSANQLLITFSEPMKADTLVTGNKLSSNIAIYPRVTSNKDTMAVGTLTAALTADKKTLIISNTNSFDGAYEITMTENVQSEKGIPISKEVKSLDLKDKTGPSYLSTTLDDTGMVASVNFSEPIDISQLAPRNVKKGTASVSNAIFLSKDNYKLSEDKQSLKFDMSYISSYDYNQTFTVDLWGIQDLAGNYSDPYPLTVSLFTDTTPKPQAQCRGVVKMGNSLVATFDKAIKTPGYAIINGTYVYGTVNTNNNKEVIYSLASGGLTSQTGYVSVTLNAYSAYNVSNTGGVTQYSTTVNLSATAAGPKITEAKLTTKTINGVSQNVLTLTYDKDVTLLLSSGALTASSNIDGTIGAASQYAYIASANGKTVDVTLNGSFTEMGVYTFTIPSAFVMDVYNNLSGSTTVRTVKVNGVTSELPGPAAILSDADDASVIYIVFNNMLDVTSAENLANYKIAGIALSSATVIVNQPESSAIVMLKTAGNTQLGDVPYPITISGIKGYKNSYKEMDTYSELITIRNNRTLPISSYTAQAYGNKVVLSFRYNISTSSIINYKFTQGTRELTLKGNPAVSNNTVTFTFNETLTANSVVTATPLVTNNIFDMSNSRALNLSYSMLAK